MIAQNTAAKHLHPTREQESPMIPAAANVTFLYRYLRCFRLSRGVGLRAEVPISLITRPQLQLAGGLVVGL
jgi:hypothetical protein